MAGPAFRRIGSGGDPLVLIHGFGGNMRIWNRVFPLLKDEVPMILVDLPGHGKSLESEGRGGAGRMAKAILNELTAEGVDRFHLAGHSMGGAVSALIAMRDPARVRSLTLIAPGGMAPEINAELLGRFSKAAAADELRAVMSEMAGPGIDWPKGYFEAVSEFRSVPGGIEALEETYRAMFPGDPAAGQGVLPRDQLEALPMPVALVWGDRDAVLPCPAPADVPANFTLSIIQGAGHMLPEERPEDVAGVLRAMVAADRG